MLFGLTVLLVYQLVGEAFVFYFRLPVPGPVVGMLLLFATLCVRGRLSAGLRAQVSEAAYGILKHLALLFVPAGVGVMLHFARIENEWLAIGVALVVSTLVTLAATALTMQGLIRLNKNAGLRRTA